ncbi:type II toxin-antitoxin system VapC family toxin [Microbacterium profundi]|uniref:type II toxin-antitoxin system VapC family toxin n=1 Tax=Microbacterium profundi TaxID=450380 RepID=UPI001F3A9A6E|nr:type II toxin-antitoxin system VapC family toxin [Microbacterium profundi]MCE7482698.1 type II toxin-antitoxin system VapC family toxin [Microbacterium profundi]
MLAVIQGEADATACAELLIQEDCRMSVANWLEASIVVDNRSVSTQRDFEDLRTVAGIALEPVTAEQAQIAREAYRRYGRGSGHPAKLNFGDCFAYALAVITGERLLFVGDDFSATDILPAIRH